jgi:hypothetical protein
MRMKRDSCKLFELVFNGCDLIMGREDFRPSGLGCSVAVHKIIQTVFKRDYFIVSDPFVAVGDNQRDKMASNIHIARPEDMMEHGMTKGRIPGQADDPGSANLGMVAPVTNTIGFCQVMQECPGPDGGCGIKNKGPG